MKRYTQKIINKNNIGSFIDLIKSFYLKINNKIILLKQRVSLQLQLKIIKAIGKIINKIL